MEVILFILALLLVVALLFWDAMTMIVMVRNVQKVDDGEFVCTFYWKGKKRIGYFYTDEKPAPEQFFQIIGLDCSGNSWALKPYYSKQK